MIVHRDYETRSAVDLRKVGAHKYAQDPTTEILCAVWVIECTQGPPSEHLKVYRWQPGDAFPAPVRQAIESNAIVAGHNAAFEAAIDTYLAGPRMGWPVPAQDQLDCTLARCAVQSLPLDLSRACQALGVKHQKDDEGHRLMLQMCKPRKPRKGEDTTKTYWWDTPDKMARLLAYCERDVYAEVDLHRALRPLQDQERPIWLLDQTINNRGVAIDLEFIRTAEGVIERATLDANARMSHLTDGAVTTVTNVRALREWAKSHGVEFPIVTKTNVEGEEYDAEVADREALEDLLEQHANGEADLPPVVVEAFELRLSAGKSSIKKLAKFRMQTGRDGRARGNLQYHAAGPGRWAGRGIQLQNLVRRGLDSEKERGLGGWEGALRDMQELDGETFESVWGSPFDVVSRMMRGAVIAAPNHRLYCGDYSQVEARGCVWAAGQTDMVKLFADGGPIYETMGAHIYGLDVDEVSWLHKTKADIMPRFVGKETVLGCGYGMGARAFRRNVKKKGRILLPEDICLAAIDGWRAMNPNVVRLWYEMEMAARNAIEAPGKVFTVRGLFSYRVKGKWLQCRLPSGRLLWYRRPSIEETERGTRIAYWGINGVTKQWAREGTWGGKLLENCVQGMCRDFLAQAMLRLEARGYPVILSVHDEVISETPEDFGSVEEFLSIMTELPPWAQGFPLKAEGSTGRRYAKG